MKRTKRKYSYEETKQYEKRYKNQPFKQVQTEKYEWVDLTFYMMDHPNFATLDVYSTKLYLYMRQWAYRSEKWKKEGVFEFSRSLARNKNIMSEAQAKRSLDTLWERGFIDKMGYGNKHTMLWSFSDRWYRGGPQTF